MSENTVYVLCQNMTYDCLIYVRKGGHIFIAPLDVKGGGPYFYGFSGSRRSGGASFFMISHKMNTSPIQCKKNLKGGRV